MSQSNEEVSELGKRKRTDYKGEAERSAIDPFRPPKKRLKENGARRAPTRTELEQLQILEEATSQLILRRAIEQAAQEGTLEIEDDETSPEMSPLTQSGTEADESEPEEEGELPEETQENTGAGQGVILMKSLAFAPGNAPKRARNWFLTWNNHPEEGAKWLIDRFDPKKYAIQEEEASTGTKHLQGVIVLNHAKTFRQMKKMFPSIHWMKCRNIHAAANYCQKIATRSGEQWIKGFKKSREGIFDPLAPHMDHLYKYQQEVLDLVKTEPHDREIHWYFSYRGRTGKSSLCKHLCMAHDAIIVGGSYKDAYYAIIDRIKQNKPPKIVVFDLPRTSGAKFLSYTAIEGIKNGLFFSTKYESQMAIFNPPHILIFANELPDMGQLSKDRWKIHHVKKDVDLDFARQEDTENSDLE